MRKVLYELLRLIADTFGNPSEIVPDDTADIDRDLATVTHNSQRLAGLETSNETQHRKRS
jgi:hypothetical protein